MNKEKNYANMMLGLLNHHKIQLNSAIDEIDLIMSYKEDIDITDSYYSYQIERLEKVKNTIERYLNKIYDTFKSLSDEEQQVFILLYEDKLKVSEASKRLNISRDKIYSIRKNICLKYNWLDDNKKKISTNNYSGQVFN